MIDGDSFHHLGERQKEVTHVEVGAAGRSENSWKNWRGLEAEHIQSDCSHQPSAELLLYFQDHGPKINLHACI